MSRSTRIFRGFRSLLGKWNHALAAAAMVLLLDQGLAAQPGPKPLPARVTMPVAEAVRSSLTGTAPLAKMASQDLGELSGTTRLERMILTLQPSQAQQDDLAQLLADQADPTSPHYRQWLTPAQFGARFGIADQDIAAVTAWLQSHGFSIDEIPTGRRTIVFSGSASQLVDAFHTELHRYTIGDHTRIANASAPQIPAALAPVIAGLVSTNDAPRAAYHRDRGIFHLDQEHGTANLVSAVSPLTPELQAEGQDSNGPSPQFTTTPSTTTYRAVGPGDFARIYNLTPLWNAGIDGTGQQIAIVSRSDLNVADVDSFRKTFGLPATKVNKIYATPSPGVTADVAETSLDVEWSGAVAKGSTIDLVIAASSLTSDGIDLSSLYIVNNNVAPVVSLSYGQCEFSLGRDGNAFYKSLWQQAAAQGQTVFVSAGDAGSTTCDQGQNYASLGLSVNGLGSTPYNVSVGGTDLYGTYTSPSTYWSSSNNPNDLSSALSYVPEVPWNDTCGNPVLLSVLKANKGYTDTSTAALCGDSKVTTSNFRLVVGGGGGVSNCTDTTDGTAGTCSARYAKPAWQTGPGVPKDGARDLPDISLFSGDGLWGSFLVYCSSALTPSGTCNLTTATNVQGAGGTSFASPAFAGIMALVNQKTGTMQGNAGPVFYQLAASQSSMDCTIENGAASPNCVYHDVDQGTNATPCYFYGKAKDCTSASSSSLFGVVNGYSAGKNYDLATGLGSVNITNLVNAWAGTATNLVPTTTTLTMPATSVTYGSGLIAQVAVASSGGSPTGDFSVLSNLQIPRTVSDIQGTLSSGTGTLTLSLLPVGNYPIHAHYAGDGTFAASDSASQAITVAQAPAALSIAASRTLLSGKLSSQLSVVLAANGTGLPPTGNVTITNTTTGSVLGIYPVAATTANTAATAVVTVNVNQLSPGSNTLTVSYAGDVNYTSTGKSVTISVTPPFSLALSSPGVTLATGASASSVSATLALASTGSAALAYPVTLACSGTLPSGATCALSSTILSAPTSSATITVNYNPQLAANHVPGLLGRQSYSVMVAAAGVVLLAFPRRRRLPGFLALLIALPLLGTVGCGSSAKSSYLALSSSTSSSALGSSVALNSVLSGVGSSHGITGYVMLTDTYRGVVRNLGTIPVGLDGTAPFSLSTLGLGNHSIVSVYGGDGTYPSATSAAVSVAVSSSSTLLVSATDANGYTVTIPLGVTLQ